MDQRHLPIVLLGTKWALAMQANEQVGEVMLGTQIVGLPVHQAPE